MAWLSLTSTLECFLIAVRSSKIWVFGSNISFSFWSSLLLRQVLLFISYLCHFSPFNCVSFVHLSRLFRPLFLFYSLSLYWFSSCVSCVSVQFPRIIHSMFTVPLYSLCSQTFIGLHFMYCFCNSLHFFYYYFILLDSFEWMRLFDRKYVLAFLSTCLDGF